MRQEKKTAGARLDQRLEEGGSFFQRVYEIVARIPPGKVVTYGQVAGWLGNPRRAKIVGWAMRAAPSGRGLPCHRVVNRMGELSPEHVFDGHQRAMLEEEGITFTREGRIRLERHLWNPGKGGEEDPNGK